MSKFLFSCLAALTLACLTLSASAVEPKVGDAAPEISAKEWINTTPVTLASLKGKVVVVEFWATWCPPCRKSIPHLIEMYGKNKDKGLVVIGLSNEKPDTVKPFAKSNNMDYFVGAGSTDGAKYGVNGIPHAFVVVDGKVAWSGHPMNGLDKAVEAEIAKLKK